MGMLSYSLEQSFISSWWFFTTLSESVVFSSICCVVLFSGNNVIVQEISDVFTGSVHVTCVPVLLKIH